MSKSIPAVELPIIRVGGGIVWSTQEYQPGSALANTAARMFTTPRGQIGQGHTTALTFPETNLKEGGRLPGGIAFNVKQVYWEAMHSDSAFARAFVANTAWAWDFIQTLVDGSPLTFDLVPQETPEELRDTPADWPAVQVKGGMPVNVRLPSNRSFAIIAMTGKNVPAVPKWGSPLYFRFALIGDFVNTIEVA